MTGPRKTPVPQEAGLSPRLPRLAWLALAALLLWHLWPLLADFATAIPYSLVPHPGRERIPLEPGDHLQFLYWCWILVDNLAGPSALFTNPYEFNCALFPQGLAHYVNFPYSLLFALFYPLGPAAAYNLGVALSYLAAGLAGYCLAREVLKDDLAALPAGLVMAFLPFRTAQLLSGHMNGFLAFLWPLCLLGLERGIGRRSAAWGGLAGLCLLVMGLMESHLVYYATLCLGLYLPLRLLVGAERETRPTVAPAAGRQAGGVFLAGLAAGLFACLWQARFQDLPLASPWLATTLLAGGLAGLILWRLLASVLPRLSDLAPTEAARLVARALYPLGLLALYLLHLAVDVPFLGSGLLLLALGWGGGRLLAGLRGRLRLARPDFALLKPLAAFAAGLAAAAGFMLHLKATVYSTSIASQGRGLGEIKLYAPQLGDFLVRANLHVERYLYLGAVVPALALAGLVILAWRGGRDAGRAALWAALGLVTSLLCLGTNLPGVPLYAWLYRHLPFFNFPRVPGRLFVFAALFLALLAGWGLRELAGRLPARPWPRLALVLGLILAVGFELRPPREMGLCLLPPPGGLEEALVRELPTGPGADRRLLNLPVWPGDSHQSSVYEFLISRTRALSLNGYSPVTPRDYVARVYWPLDPLNRGEVTARGLATLAENRVGLVAFHDDAGLYSSKISPFPPALARTRLLADPAFVPKGQFGNVFLLAPRPAGAAGAAGAVAAPTASPVRSLWEAEWLKRETGRVLEDPAASGYGLLFGEPAGPLAPLGPRDPAKAGNLVEARAGRDRPGFLAFGPYQTFPAGDYRARFRLRGGPEGNGASAGRLEVTAEEGRCLLARSELTAEALPADEAWHDLALGFALSSAARLEFRVYFAGGRDLALDVVVVEFAGRGEGPGFYPAAELWRQTGELRPDPRVPGGQAVAALAGWTPPLYLMHGPQATLEPGRYRASFRLAAAGPAPAEAPAAELVPAGDLGRRPLGHRLVTAGELTEDYRDFPVEFTVDRRLEIDLRVLYRQGVSLHLAGVALERL